MARFLENYKPKKKKKETSKPKKETKSPSVTNVNNRASNSTFMGGGSSTKKTEQNVSRTSTRTTTSTPRRTSMTPAQTQKTYGQPTKPTYKNNSRRDTTTPAQRKQNAADNMNLKQQKIRESTADRIQRRQEKIFGPSQKDDDRRSIAQAQKSGDYQRVQELRGKPKAGSLREKYERWDKDIADTITHTVKQGLAADARVVNQSAKGITDKDAFLYTTEEQRKEADEKFQKRESKLAKKVEEESQAIEDIQSKHGYIGRQALSAISSTTGMGMDIAANAVLPGSGLAHMWSRSTGTSMGQVNKKAASLRNQLEATGQYSKEELDEMFKNTEALDLANAAASGGVEVLSELLFPGIGAARKVIGGKGMSIAERVGAKLFNKVGAKASTGILKNIAKGTAEEIAEEEIGGPVQAWAANLIYGNKFQGYNEDAIKRTLMDESNALRSNIASDDDARAVAARLNSKEFMDESVKMYMDSGNTKKEAEELAELSKEYLTASLTGDVDAMKDAQDKMVKILAGGENSMKEKFTLQDAIDAAVSTAMMTTVTGAPGAISTMQIGNSYKENVGLDAVKQQAEMIRNWSDGKEASQAQAVIDHIDDGGDISGTQVYEIIQQAGEVAAENKQSEDAKNRLAQTEMNKRDLRISPIAEDGTLGPQTEQRYEQIFSSTVSRYDTLTKIGESAGFERDDVEIGADIGAAFETGVISSEQINELARGSAAVKTVFEDVTGIDISQFDSYPEMRDALMAQAADNMVNSARLEQAAWNDEARGAMAQSISKGIGASGNEAVLKAFMGIDPRDRGKFLLTGEAASRVYEYAKTTESDWNEVRHTFRDMFKGADESALRAAFDAAKEDKLIEETEYWGRAVRAGEKLSQHSAEQVQVPGEVINKENLSLGAEDQLFLQSWAKAFHVNYDLVSTLPVKVKTESGEIVEGQAEGSFRPSTNTLTINVNEGVLKPVRKTIQHELSHSAIYAPEEMLNLLKYIRDAWYRKDPEGYFNAIREAQARYSGEQKLSDLKALEELMADGAADFDFWNDADLAERMANENPSLAQKVLNVIRDVLRKIRNILASGNIRNKEYSDAVFAYAVDMSKAEELYIRAINAAKNAKADMAIDELQDEANGNVATEMEDSFSIVQDPKLIQELEADEHRTTYRAMALIDGKLYPPMASKIQDESGNWNLQQGLELGQWVESDATTDSRMFNAKGQFHLMKDNGDDLWVAYNPYIHSSDSMMNDQFSSYHKRPNLVVVEGEIPESEVTSGYRAETTLDDGRRILAKDTTGPTQKWNSGDVFKELKKRYGRKRTVYLTNHFKPTRIVPDSEVAQHINSLVADTDVAVPYNVVPPGVRRELQNLGTNMEQNKQAKYYVDLNEDTSYSIPASNELLAARDDTAIFINNTAGANYIDMIFNGKKTEETRTRRTLDSFIGKEVAVTDGKQVYGTIVLGEPHKYTAEEFRSEEAQAKHRVPVGDKYDSENGKWAYPIESYNRYSEPLTLTDDKNYLGSRQARQVVTEDRSNWSKGVFPLTGKPVSQEYKDAVEYLENGGTLGEGGFDAAWYNSLPEVKEARSRIGDAEETINDNSPERMKLREGWVQDLMNYGSARDAFVDGKRTTVYDGIVRQDRRIDLIVGLPSSGKSSALVDPISFKYKSRLLDSDEAKKLIPEFDDGWGAGRVHEESSQLLSRAFYQSLENGDNIVMPILGKSVNSIEKRIKLAREADYDVYLRMCDLPANKAAARNLIRFINTGRFVDLTLTSLAALNGPAESFDAVVKKGEIDGYTEVSNDVERGQNPEFIRGEKDISYDWRDSGQGREGLLGDNRTAQEGEATEESEVRYSLSSISEAAGLSFSKRDGRTILTDRNGKEITEVTPAYLKKTPIGRLLTLSESDAYNVMSDAAVDNRLKFLSDLFNMIIDTQDIDLIWAVSGTLGYDPMHLVDENTPQNKIKEQKSKFASITGNSDPQYKSTIDFTTICVKTQAIIDAMSALMKKLNRGLSEHEIIDIVYNETYKAKEQVPCPVCYVFSRWVGLGNLFSKIQEFQKRYPEGTDMSLIAEEYDTLQAEVGEMASSLGIRGGKARDILYRQTLERKNELDELVYYDRASDEEKQELEVIDRRLDVLDHWSWLGKTRLDPNYKEVPADVLFDINAGREFATKYPAVWKFRTTRGPSLGKAAAPYTPSRLGDTIRGIASPGALKDIGTGARPFLAKSTTKTARNYFNKAVMNAKRQNRMNGQRLQSTSDFRFEYGLDYILSFIELEAIGAKAQMYTKVPEAVKFLASTQAEVNCSIMPLGRGVDENGNLVFSDVTGMSWADALALSKAYDNVQPILVAIGPDHLTAAMADSDITMIIPYHASGSSEGRYISMMQTVGESVEDRTDFAEYEGEHEIEDATPEQILARNLRIDILTGKKEILKPAEKQILENNEILRQLYIRIYGMDENGNEAKPDSKYVENYDENGNDADCYGVYLTKDQAKVMMPYEYWDKTSTIKDADKQGKAYQEYCKSLGITPVFSGWDSKGKYHEDMDFSGKPGYWKTLIDRCMYNNDGTYHKQNAINLDNVDLDMLDSEMMRDEVVKPLQVNDPAKTEEIVKNALKRIEAEQVSFSISAKYDAEYDKATRHPIDWDKAQELVNAAAKDAGFSLQVYHGSKAEDVFYKFEKPINNDSRYIGGAGFVYVTEDESYAENYSTSYDWEEPDGFILEGFINPDNFLDIGVVDHIAFEDNAAGLPEAPDFNDEAAINSRASIDLKGVAKALNMTPYELIHAIGERVYSDIGFHENTYDLVNRPEFAQLIRDRGYNGIKLMEYGSQAYGLLDITQFKSSEAITYDDEGSPIPLSQRFDPSNEDIRYSLPTQDADGNFLTDGQMEYFKNSQARDEQGRLLVLYHHSDAMFDSFNPDLLGTTSGYRYPNTAYGFFVTDDLEFSKQFGKNQYKLYANIENLIVHPYGANFKYSAGECEAITRRWLETIDPEQFDYYEELREEEPDLTLYDYYMDLFTPGESPYQHADYEREVLEEAGFDAVEIVEGIRDGVDKPTTSFALFYREQPKFVDNQDPTEGPELSFSIASDNDAMTYAAAQANSTDDLWATDPVTAEGRVRYSISKRDFVNGVTNKWNPAWKTNGEILKEESVERKIREVIMGAMRGSDTKAKYRQEMVKETMLVARKAYNLMKKDKPSQAANLLYDHAHKIIDNLEFFGTDSQSEFERYKDLRDYLRTTKITVPYDRRRDIDYSTFRKRNFGKILLGNDGIAPDVAWQELNEMWPEVFTEDIKGDIPGIMLQIENALDICQPMAQAYTSEQCEEFAGDIADALYDILYEGEAYKSLADRYEDKAAAMKERHEEALIRMKEKLDRKDAQYAELKNRYQYDTAYLRAQKEKAVREVKEKNKQKEAEKKERSIHRQLYNRVLNEYKELTDKLLKPSKERSKNIPEQLRQPLAEMLAAFDLEKERSKELEEKYRVPTRAQLNFRQLKDAMEKVAKEEGAETEFDAYLNYIGKKIEAIADKMDLLGDYSIDALDNEDIETIKDMLTGLNESIKNYQQLEIDGEKYQAQVKCDEVGEGAKEYKSIFGNAKKHDGLIGFLDNIVNMGELTPIYFFRQIKGLYDMYRQMRKGFDNYVTNEKMVIDKIADILSPFYKTNRKGEQKPGSEIEEWRHSESAETFDLTYGPITLTIAQRMSLYCLSKREGAKSHMLSDNGGIVASEITAGSKLHKAKENIKGRDIQTEQLPLTPADIQTVVASLTPEQIDIADKLQALMSNEMSEIGNATSMKLIGIRMYKEKDYFPIKVQGDSRATNLDQIGMREKVRNPGFSNPLEDNATNPIIIDDIFSVVASHCNEMNLYAAYAVPLTNFMKVYNGSVMNDNGKPVKIKALIRQTYGDKAIDYIENFLNDINGNSFKRRGGMDDVLDAALGQAKKAAVFANLRVALQQPTAIVRAFAVMHPKYFVGVHPSQKATQEMFEHCPIGQWKSWGYYDTHFGRDIEDVMMGRNVSSKASVFMSEIYGMLDNMTWGMIWQAVKNEVKAEHKGIDETSQEFWELCNERASYVFDTTQVVDSPFHRSNDMRSKNGLVKQLTSFQAEPTLSFNVLRQGFVDAIEAAKKGDSTKARRVIERVIAVWTLQALTVAFAQSFVDALRRKGHKDSDDDEDAALTWYQEIMKYFMRNFGTNFEDDINPMNNVYWVKDFAPGILNAIKGEYVYGQQNLVYQWYDSLTKGIQMCLKKWADGEGYSKTWYDCLTELMGGVGYMAGLPAKTGMRGVKNAFHWANKIFGINVFADDGRVVDSAIDSFLDKFRRDPTGSEGGGLFDSIANRLGYQKAGSSEAEPATEDSSYSMTADDLPDNLTDEQKADILKAGEKRSKKATPAEEQQQLSYDTMLYNAMKAAAGLEGEEYNKKVYSSVANGLKGYIADGDYMSIGMMRTVIEQAGGDVAYFDQRVLDETKSAYKKVLSYDQTLEERSDMKAMYRYMMGHGMTPEQVSADILYSSDLAKDMKVAYRLGDNELIYEAMLPLVDAGIMRTDLERLYENRNKMDLTKYKSNGRFKDKLKSMGTFIWPTDGVVTSHFGYRGYVGPGASTNHPAIDIGAPEGTPVVAADGGVVIYAGRNGGYGNSVGIKHDNGMVTYYNHLSAWNVKVGDTVGQGQRIANVGQTGVSFGAHLDFKILDKNGKPVDPEKYLDKRS